jgi:hypothetical protein
MLAAAEEEGSPGKRIAFREYDLLQQSVVALEPDNPILPHFDAGLIQLELLLLG